MKQINIKPNLDESEFRKKLKDIESGKYDININVNSKNTVQGLNNISNSAKNTTTVFDRLKNAVSGTFSSRKIETTAYLALLKEINDAAERAKDTMVQLDKVVTDLSVATGDNRSSVKDLLKDYNSMAKQLASTATQVGQAADDYLRAGKSMKESNQLIKDSIMLSKLGQINSSEATEDLLATMNGFDMSVNQVNDALDAMVAIDMAASTSSGDIATALKYCASSADIAGVSFNKLAAMIGTVQDKTMQSAETVGTFFNTLLSRYRNVKIGNYLSDDGEDLSDYESVLKSIGIQLRDSQGEFRNFETILDEMAQKWNTLSSVQQASLLKIAAGTRQQNRFSALLEGYNKTLELTEVAANSAGTAVEKFNKSYKESLEAKTNTLQASFESMIMNSDMSEVYGGILDATTALVNLVNKTNALKGAMGALAVTGVTKAFLSIKTGAYEAYVNLNKFKSAMDIVDATSISSKSFDKLLLLSNGLSKSQLQLMLSTDALTISQKKQVLVTTGLSEEQALAQLQSWKMVAANTGLTASTTTASNAIKGFGASLKALAVAHPVLLAITVTLGAIAGAVKIVDALTTSMNEQREAFENAQQDYTDACTKLDELKTKLSETTSRIAELIDKSNNGTITLVEQAELDKLKLTNEELRLMIQNQEEVKKQKAKEASDEAYKTYTRENRMETDDTASKQEQYYQASSDAEGFHVGAFLDRASELSDFDYAIKANEQKLEEFQKQNEEFQAQLNATSDESLKAQYQHSIDLNNNLISNYTNSNEKLKESAEKMAEETFSDKIEKYEAFKQTLMNSMNSDGTFDNPQYQAMWDDMQKKEMDLYRYTGRSAEWNTVKLDSIIDDKSYQAIVDKLKTALNEGTLTEDDIKVIDVLNDKLNDTDLILEDGQSAADIFIKYLNKFKETGTNAAQSVSGAFTDLTSLLTESDDKSQTANLADLQSEADLLSTIQKELDDNGRIGVSSMQSIIKKYPEAKAALSDYMQGIISEQELFSQLETIYENDKNQYIQSVVDKSQTDEEFFNAVMTNYPELYNELSSLYGNDVDNWSNMEQAKLEITNKAIKELAGVWSDYFKVVQDANGKLMVQTTGWYDAGMYSADPDEVQAMDEEYNNMYNHFQSIVDGANAAVDALDNYSFKQVSSSINVDWKGLGKDSSSSSSGSDSSSEPLPQDFNWVERLLSKISKAYDRLKNKVSDTTRTWLNRNNALSDSMETLLSEINAQSDAYDFYMDRFNSYDLDGYYKDQIANGSFNIETVYDEDLKDAISDCQDLYDKAQDAADSVQSLNIEIRQLAKSRFDNIQSQFEEVLGKVNSIKDLYSKDNNLLEEQGWFASTLLNNSMMEQEQKNLEKLEQERDTLTKALNSAMASGKIEAESEDWYSMQSAIDDCTSSIYDAKKALVEYDNAIRQINWDAFDRTRDDVSNLIDETQFLVDLLKDEDITDDNGNMNDNGKAAQALIAQKYQLYLNQAKAYKDEILKINEELANDPYDKELLDRKQELIKAQQEAINSSISEKEALKNLVQEGYDAFLDKLDEVIQKYKDLMNQQKDAYDYEKSIAEKTKALNALEKQYSAVQGDNSEEGKKNIQQLKDQINTAKDDLKDTEYEKLISDTQAILDNLADTTKTWLDERLDSFDITMQEIIEQSNANASNIADTITSTANDYGIKLSESMSSIWSTNANNITNGINCVLGDFSNKFVEGNNAINKVCGDINAAVQGLLKNSNDEAQRVADEIARQQAEQNANTNGGYSDGGGSSDSDSDSNDWSDNWDNSDSGSSDDSGSDGVNWIYEEDSYPKDLLDIENSIVDRLKYNSIASSFGARAGYYEQITGDSDYYGTAEQNILLLDYLKSHGLKKGSKSAHGGLTLTDEDGLGSEVIFSKKYGTLRKLDAGDMVFNADQVEKLWNLSKGITTPNMYMDNLGAKLPDIPNISNNLANKVDVEFGDVTLSLPNVKNYEDFMKQMVSDKRFLKAVQEGTLGQVLGRNSLNMLTFR
ncbi:MAG: phage tail tape measure protein [Lachnospira sp.]|nr:phage tail tape measure protein [Lachnospira sp.]